MRNFVVLISIVFSFTAIFQSGKMESVPLSFVCAIISAISIWGIFKSDLAPFSLKKMYYIFTLFFMGIAPAIQYKNNVKLQDTSFDENDYLLSAMLVLCSMFVFSFVYSLFYKRSTFSCKNKDQTKFAKNNVLNKSHDNIRKKVFSLNQKIIFVCVAIGILYYFLWYNNYNIFSLFVRGGIFYDRQPLSQMMLLISEYFLRPIPMVLFLAVYLNQYLTKYFKLFFFLIFLCVDAPTSMARFSAAALWLPVILIMVPYFRKGMRFSVLLVFGLLVVFPFLDNFRNLDDTSEIVIGLNFSQFEELHFDAFSNIMRVLKSGIITYGFQLLGPICFWVPRSIWPDKPIGSGAFIAKHFGLDLENISMPLLGEGYLNFGIIGSLLFVAFFACYSAIVDKSYWKKCGDKDGFSLIQYLLLVSLSIFMQRGDLLSSFAYTISMYLSLKLVKKLIYS